MCAFLDEIDFSTYGVLQILPRETLRNVPNTIIDLVKIHFPIAQ